MKIKFPTEEEFAKEIADKALNAFDINGKTIMEWIEILCDVYAVVESYDIDFHRDRGDLTDFEKDMLEALRLTEE